MTTLATQPDTDILAAASELVPMLRRNSPRVDEARRVIDENIDALTDIGVYRIARPKRFGGLETPLPIACKVLAEIGRGCASTGWVAATAVVSTWMLGQFPDSVQEEVFATEDARLCGSFTPSAEIVPTDGGYLLTGRWPYNTGCLHAHWNVLAARLMTDDGPSMKMVAVPMSDMSIEDDWHTYGLRGTGSCTTVGTDVFVPADRVIDSGDFMAGNWVQGRSNYDSPWYKLPTWPAFLLLGGGSMPYGVAQAAVDVFAERMVGRAITYTVHTDQSQTAPAQLDLATAAVRADAAATLSNDFAERLWQMAQDNVSPDMLERQKMRAITGFIVQLSREAVEIATRSSGASSIRTDCVTQQIFRDSEALAMHAGLNLDALYESYGRVILGLEPTSPLA